LELSLVSALPHVAIAGNGKVSESDAVPTGSRSVIDGSGGSVELPVHALVDQPPGAHAHGPAVIEGPFFTMRLPEGWRFHTTAAGDLLLSDERS
jgi:N-methylhydantoinase A/oxoprolinase/acetone carboxylase beta subunit